MGWDVEVITFFHPSASQEYNIFDKQPVLNSIDLGDLSKKLPNHITRFLKPEEGRLPGLTDSIVNLGKRVINDKEINIIFATSSCYNSIYSAAYSLSKHFEIPWIADFRDIEEQKNDFHNRTTREKLYLLRIKLRRFFVLRSAASIISISLWHQNLLRGYNEKSFLIFNGFDQNLYNKLNVDTNKSLKFKIVYLGSLLTKEIRDPSIFLDACCSLISKGKIPVSEFSCVFIGQDSEKIYDFLEVNNEEYPWIETQKYISHDRIHKVLGEASMLLLLTSNNTKGVMTTKFFEYLAASKPIILCPNDDGSIGSIIDELQIGLVCKTIEKTENYILEQFQNWKKGQDMKIKIDLNKLKVFKREYQAEQLNKLLFKALND